MAKTVRRRKVTARSRKGAIARTRHPVRRWSQRVTRESSALDLEEGVFTRKRPAEIAASLRRSAMRSKRRKAIAYRSALSMLIFYINRAGKNLPAARKRISSAPRTSYAASSAAPDA